MNYLKMAVISMLLTLGISNAKQVHNFSDHQKENLVFACDYGRTVKYSGISPEEMCYVFSAIIWQESSAGNIDPMRVRKGHHSYGYFQNYIVTVRSRLKMQGYNLTNQQIISMLSDRKTSALYAKIEILEWLKHRKGNLHKALASYNAGWKYERGVGYANSIKKKMAYLRKWSNELGLK